MQKKKKAARVPCEELSGLTERWCYGSAASCGRENGPSGLTGGVACASNSPPYLRRRGERGTGSGYYPLRYEQIQKQGGFTTLTARPRRSHDTSHAMTPARPLPTEQHSQHYSTSCKLNAPLLYLGMRLLIESSARTVQPTWRRADSLISRQPIINAKQREKEKTKKKKQTEQNNWLQGANPPLCAGRHHGIGSPDYALAIRNKRPRHADLTSSLIARGIAVSLVPYPLSSSCIDRLGTLCCPIQNPE
ncbi:hypothetical protein L249_1310, partial [Ophiocordyceps polyrhachis-furcata BCC 54312]